MTRAHEKLVVRAHIEHAARDGRTLCGEDRQQVRPCPDCLARWVKARLVHVENPGKPGRSLCGQPLMPDVGAELAEAARAEHWPADIARVFAESSRPVLAYVSTAVAEQVVADSEPAFPVCPGCSSNMGRLLEAARLRALGRVGTSMDVARRVQADGAASWRSDTVTHDEDEGQ